MTARIYSTSDSIAIDDDFERVRDIETNSVLSPEQSAVLAEYLGY